MNFNRLRMLKCIVLLFIALNVSVTSGMDKTLQGVACRSVHLSYSDVPDSTAFYNEVKVEQSAPGTYFCVCGFSRGYYGIQELYDGRKVVIFSVWDPGNQNNPNEVDETQRVKLLHNDPTVRVKRFGNEGTGGQSFLDFNWKVGETYRFIVSAKRNNDRTEYASFFYHPDKQTWLHLVTFSTLTPDTSLKGYYAFVEDFRRNRESATMTRTAVYPNGWVRLTDGNWQPIAKARFTGDSNPVMNINAGLKNEQFYLSTGGHITNSDVPLRQLITRKLDTNSSAIPEDAEPLISQWLSNK